MEKEMEEDLRKKYKHTGTAYQEPPTAEESLDMLKNSNLFEAVFMFVKYAIKHFIKQMHKSNQNWLHFSIEMSFMRIEFWILLFAIPTLLLITYLAWLAT